MLQFKNAQAAGAYYARKRNRKETAVIDDAFAPAWGTVTFGGVNPGNGQTITLNGTAITFVTGTPSGAQVKIGVDFDATLAALGVYLAANPIAGINVSVDGDGLMVLSAVAADTSVTLAASDATVSNGTLQKQQVNARVPLDGTSVDGTIDP